MPAAPEFNITDDDLARCAELLAAFDAANRDLEASDDFKVVLAIRAIAEAGSGMPLSSWATLTTIGYQASDRAWRWLAACSSAAAVGGNHALTVTIAMFAIAWDEVAPPPSPADPVELGLLAPPVPILAEIVAASLVASTSLPSDLVVWHVAGDPITAGMALRGHARVVRELAGKGAVTDAASALADRLLA